MSKAEERALEAYPKKIEWVGNQWDGAPFDVNSKSRVAYEQGYHQAEKDLKLTWEDMRLIDRIASKLLLLRQEDDKDFYQEVLKRFKERKINYDKGTSP